MTWEAVVTEWVNCLQLTENPVESIKELADGKFLSKILQLLFRTDVDANHEGQIFNLLQKSVQNHYDPAEWIDFLAAERGDEEELLKILSVLISISVLESEEILFRENPANKLSNETQTVLKDFLESVISNEKVVVECLLPLSNKAEKLRMCIRNEFTKPRVLFGKPDFISAAESPLVYASSPSVITGISSKISPLQDLFHSPELENELLLMSDRKNEISALRNTVRLLKAHQQDILDELSHYKDENKCKTSKIDDLSKELNSLREEITMDRSSHRSMWETEFPSHSSREVALKEQLRKCKLREEKLEMDYFSLKTTFEDCEEQLTSSKEKIKVLAKKVRSSSDELEMYGLEKEAFSKMLSLKDEEIKTLQVSIEDLQDCMNSANLNTQESSSFGELNMFYISDSNNSSRNSVVLPEDMGTAVVDVQLKEAQSSIEELKTELVQLKLTFQTCQRNLESATAENELHLIELAALNEAKCILEEKIKVSDNQLQKFEDVLKELEFSKNVAVLEKEDACAKLNETLSKLGGVEHELEIVLKEKVSIEDSVAKAKKEIKTNYARKFEDLKNKLKEIMRNELQLKDEELMQKVEENEVQKEDIDKMKRERAGLRRCNIDLRNEMYILNQSFLEQKIKYGALHAQYEELVAQLQKVNNEYKSHTYSGINLQSRTNVISESWKAVNEFDSPLSQQSSTNSLTKESNGSNGYRRMKAGSGSLFAYSDEDSFQLNEKNSDLHFGIATELNAIEPESKRISELQESLLHISQALLESVQSNESTIINVIPSGSDRLFVCENELDFQVDESNSAELRRGNSVDKNSIETDLERLTELQRRNTLMPPHMRSCYPAEFQFLSASCSVDENNVRALPSNENNRMFGSSMQKTFSESIKRRSTMAVADSGMNIPNPYHEGATSSSTSSRAPFSPTSSFINGDGSGSISGRNPLKNKMKSEMALSPRKSERSLRYPIGWV